MRILRPLVILLSVPLFPCFATEEGIHWDFEQFTSRDKIPDAIAGVKDKSGQLELTQPNAAVRPTISRITPTSPPGTAGNKQSALFSYDSRQYLQANSPQLNIGADAAFTLELWVNPRTYSESNASTVSPTLIQKRGGEPTDTSKPGYQLVMNHEGKIIFRAEGRDGGGKTLISNAMVPLDKWTHIAVTRDTSGLFRLYINGQIDIIAGGPRFPGSLENDREFLIGANRFVQHRTGFFDGMIDDVRLSPVELHPEAFLIQ
jgi:hypothetical protein